MWVRVVMFNQQHIARDDYKLGALRRIMFGAG
jgi:hypothetical protein